MLQIGNWYNDIYISNSILSLLDMPKELDNAINNVIIEFEASEQRTKMSLGEMYYRTDNKEINERRQLIYGEDEDGVYYEQDDPYKSNFKMASSYYKLLVDQKVNYSLGKDIKAYNNENEVEFVNKKMQKEIKKAGKNGCKKGIGWLYPYINEDGEFKIMSMQPEQIVPLWNTENSDELEMIIRYYKIDVLNDKGEFVKVNRVEIWDKEQVSYFQQTTDSGLYYLINNYTIYSDYNTVDYVDFGENPRTHFSKNMRYGDKKKKLEKLNWGRVPFIPIYSNDEEDYDLKTIKNYIDVYDYIQSDFANKIVDFQDIYWTLKGYHGEDLSKFMAQVKRYKALKVDEDGDARANTIDIPYEAFMTEIENLEDKIYKFFPGVNLAKIAGGSLTNVVIKAYFSNMDIAANQFEEQVEEAIESIIDMYNIYAGFNTSSALEVDDIKFNRSMIMNEQELATLANASRGSLSEKTRLANDPRVDDVDDEIKMLKEEEDTEVVKEEV